jgi:uncharacterized protein YeaO (DUF488 family)
MIQHASIYDCLEHSEERAGLRVLVMRHWPRGVRRKRTDVWLRDAAPSHELLRAYAHEGLAWDEFERRYRSEILGERADVLEQLRELERQHGILTLLCHERIPPRAHCHREVLLDLIEQTRPSAIA